MNVAFPYRFDARLRTAEADDDRHIRDLIEQLLFTTPGERVNRPNFGSGLLQLIFAPASRELATALQLMIQGTLQQWLGELILVEAVDVLSDDATINVTVRYLVRRSQQRTTAEFSRARP